MKTQLKQLDMDLKKATLLQHMRVNSREVLSCAEKLGAVHSEILDCRSTDLFDVAATIEAGYDTFRTLNSNQKKMATMAAQAVEP